MLSAPGAKGGKRNSHSNKVADLFANQTHHELLLDGRISINCT